MSRSQQAILASDTESRVSASTLQPGAVIDAVVVRIEPYGIWLDWRGTRGVVLLPEIAWFSPAQPAEHATVGELLRVAVLSVQKDQFTASIRALRPEQNPWRDPSEFAVGKEFSGTIVLAVEYGYFVEIKRGVSALLRPERASGPLRIGDRVRVRVEVVDPERQAIEVAQIERLS